VTLEAYCWTPSAVRGEAVGLRVSTDAPSFDVECCRPRPGTPTATGAPSLYTGGTRVSFERPLAEGFLVKLEPIGRMMQPEPDREAMGFRTWARPLGLSDWCSGPAGSRTSGPSRAGPRPPGIGSIASV
jgi:hypothetical protein